MGQISLVVNTLNEESNIKDCINSASKWVDEVIVCDMHSEDKTVEIALSLGAKVIFFERAGFVEPARFYAISQASSEWVLVLDADEQLTDALAKKLVEIVKRDECDAVSFSSLFNYFGGSIYHGGFFNSNWTRFFKKQVYLDTYSENELTVHQNFSALSKLGKKRRLVLPKEYYILHNAYPTIDKYVNKTIDYYARVEAKQKLEKGVRFSAARMIFDFLRTFIMNYFIRLGFLDGIRGLILCFYYSVYRFNIWANLWFLQKTNVKQND
ncbi:MAG: glycosyltransferase family 2 protein [Cyclobacteriaceae bacterium]|nr:glycosyltransferase family 2 protein [Cyclobacteriaceae bacterium]